jgi:cysteine desulfurase / selenocysteine lyase
VYLDSAGSSMKSIGVIDRLTHFYPLVDANTNGENSLHQAAKQAVQRVRSLVPTTLNAAAPDEIVFGRSATRVVNGIAYALEPSQVKRGDEALIAVASQASTTATRNVTTSSTASTLSVF